MTFFTYVSHGPDQNDTARMQKTFHLVTPIMHDEHHSLYPMQEGVPLANQFPKKKAK